MSISEKYAAIRDAAMKKIEKLKQQTLVLVGTATCGRAAGAIEVLNVFREEAGKRQLDVVVEEVGCMGHCYAEPLVVIAKPGFPTLCYGPVDEGMAQRLVVDFLVNDDPCYEFAMAALEPNDEFPTFEDFPRGVIEKKIILADCGFIDPDDIDHYIAKDGYAALSKVLEMEPRAVIEEIKDAKLRGRGGAGFPTGIKWERCYEAKGSPKYVICNADEGDPGAFMDRAILESNPHQLI
jgi:NADH-quinone oxidoreductase subunit F